MRMDSNLSRMRSSIVVDVGLSFVQTDAVNEDEEEVVAEVGGDVQL